MGLSSCPIDIHPISERRELIEAHLVAPVTILAASFWTL